MHIVVLEALGHYISKKASTVIGVDTNEEAVKLAKLNKQDKKTKSYTVF